VGGAGGDTIDGGDGDDFITSNGSYVQDAVDHLSGGAGNDYLTIDGGDFADGGSGTDTLFISLFGESASGVSADFRTLTDGGTISVLGGTLAGFEFVGYISATMFNDTIVAGAVAGIEGITLDGWDGNDDLTGSTGRDYIYGGAGDDILRSGGGYNSAVLPSGDRLNGRERHHLWWQWL
jgi:Ca2+-binding RTX toxin-like protein